MRNGLKCTKKRENSLIAWINLLFETQTQSQSVHCWVSPTWRKGLSRLALTSSLIYTYQRFQSNVWDFLSFVLTGIYFLKTSQQLPKISDDFPEDLQMLSKCLNVWKQGCSKNFWAFPKLVFCDAVKGPEVNMKRKIWEEIELNNFHY